MATVPRQPVFVARRELPRSPGTALVVTQSIAILASAFAIPLPLGAARTFPEGELLHPARNRLPADTSRGMPKTLTQDTTFAPSNLTESMPLQRPQRVLQDTSFASTAVYAAVPPPPAPNPFFSFPSGSVDRPRLPADTSNFSFAIYRGAAPPPPPAAPIFSSPQLAPQLQRTLLDTSSGVPKALTSDATPPFAARPQYQIERPRPVFDTSRGTNICLATFLPPPPHFTSRTEGVAITQRPMPGVVQPRNIVLQAFTTYAPFAARPMAWRQERRIEVLAGLVQNLVIHTVPTPPPPPPPGTGPWFTVRATSAITPLVQASSAIAAIVPLISELDVDADA